MSRAKNRFRASAENFAKIPGSPIAYWVGEKMIKAFEERKLNMVARAAIGIITGKNDWYVRRWSEVSNNDFAHMGLSRDKAAGSSFKWFPYAKGGEFRRWYGNFDYVVNWENDGERMRTTLTADGKRTLGHNFNLDRIFNLGVSWTVISIGEPSFRIVPLGFLFDAAAGICQSKGCVSNEIILAFLNTPVASCALECINPTINLHPGYLDALPFKCVEGTGQIVEELISLSRSDWDEYETSWDFKANPLVREAMDEAQSTVDRELTTTHSPLTTLWERVFSRRMECAARMKELEEENNRLFIAAYGLEDELTPDVAWKDVSLTGNPFYRYKVDAADAAGRVPPELAARACADTMRELISYGIGCLMGRYSLAKEGLVLASQGETMADYWKKVDSGEGLTTISPDDDGIIPVVAGETAFTDNAPQRIIDFIRVAFGEGNLTANLNFIEAALGMTLEDYLAKEFWTDHKRMYKNRPIYWLFRSKKGAFQALVYLHRMDAYTVSKIRTAYLLPHIEFLRGRIAAESARGAELTAKERARLKKMQQAMEECLEYEGRLHVVADRMEAIDLDDGVLANYAKFGDVLAKLK